jgi:hypothetical protein
MVSCDGRWGTGSATTPVYTARHVVEGCDLATIVDHQGVTWSATVTLGVGDTARLDGDLPWAPGVVRAPWTHQRFWLDLADGRREEHVARLWETEFMIFDGTLEPGSSGSPARAKSGEVVGVVSYKGRWTRDGESGRDGLVTVFARVDTLEE